MTHCRMFAFCPPSVFAACAVAFLLGAKAKPSGADPFVPTKRDWLVVSFNAAFSVPMTNSAGFVIYAEGTDDPNEIQLCAHVIDSNMPAEGAAERRRRFTNSLTHLRTILEAEAEILGFDDWLKIREKIADSK
jgi:hypothetical protein